MQTEGIAHVVESEAVNQLRVKQRHDVAPPTEGSGLGLRAGVRAITGHEELGNEVANLPWQIQFRLLWNGTASQPTWQVCLSLAVVAFWCAWILVSVGTDSQMFYFYS